MKDNLIEQEITRIKEILYNGGANGTTINESTEVISEQLFPTIRKYLGKSLATKMETNLGDDVMKKLEGLFLKGSANFMKNSANEIVILTKSGTQVPMKTVEAALDAVADGKMTADDVAKLLPKKLKDGTDFATVFKSELKNAKPKPIAPKPPKPAAPKPAASKPAASSSTATAATTSTAAKATLDLENYITSNFPKISNDRNVLAPLVQDFEKEISGMSTVDVINHINAKCVKLEQGLKNVADVVGQETAEENVAIINKVKYYAKKYGPLSLNASGKTNWLKTIPKTIAWLAAMDVIVLGAVEARKEKKNLADTVAKRAAERGAGFWAAAVTFFDKIIGSKSDSNNNSSNGQNDVEEPEPLEVGSGN